MLDTSIWLQGFILGLAMFVAPGPKDILILRETLAGQSPLLLIAIAVGSDILLIALGIIGLSALLERAPTLTLGLQIVGISLLLLHGIHAGRSAWRGTYDSADTSPAPGPGALRKIVTVSLFNPAAWLDTVLVIGGVGATLPQVVQISFAIGAVAASLLWFAFWVFGTRFARRIMTSVCAWRLLDAGVALAMIALAVLLAAGLNGD